MGRAGFGELGGKGGGDGAHEVKAGSRGERLVAPEVEQRIGCQESVEAFTYHGRDFGMADVGRHEWGE